MMTIQQPDEGRTGRLLILLILTLTSVLMMTGLQKDLPFAAEVDEADFACKAIRMAQQGTLNPRWFGHPGSTILYPLTALYTVMHKVAPSWGVLEAPPRNRAAFEHKAWPFYLAGRLVNMAYFLGCTVLVWLVGRRAFDGATGLIGAWLFATTPFVILYASIIRTDLSATFFGLLCLLFCLRHAAQPSMTNRLLAGLAAGLALSSRYFMIALLPILPLAEMAAARNYPPSRRALRWIGWSAALGLIVLIGFALTSPYAIIRHDITLRNIAGEARPTHLGADGLTPAGNLLWYFCTLLPRHISRIAIALMGLGLLFVLRQRRTSSLILAANAGLFMLAICLPRLHWDRWIIPALPMLFLFAAWALVVLVRRCHSRWPGLKRYEALVLALLAVIVSARALRRSVEESIQYTRPGTRSAALQWVIRNVPPGARFFQEGQSIALQNEPYVLDEYYALAPQWLKNPGQYLDYDYIVANSRMYDRYFAEPNRYLDEVGIYRWLFTHGTLAAEFTPSPARAGPTIRIYTMPRPPKEKTTP